MIELLFVDEHVAVFNKPSGLVVHRGWANDAETAMSRVRDALGGHHVYPVHRLDRGTSGALLFARHRDAAPPLARAFEEGRVARQYLALVRGEPPREGVIDRALSVRDGGPSVPALTRFRLVKRSPVDRCSLVLALPETGRLHQIRRHLRHISHPIVGDVNYGSGVINRHYRATYGLHRLALHAHGLAFPHPATGAPIEVTAPLPSDLGAALEALALPLAPD